MEEEADTLESRHQLMVVENTVAGNNVAAMSASGNGGEGAGPSAVPVGDSGGLVSSASNTGKRKRHTPYQIAQMEMFYQDCPNPNESQRAQLAQRLGLEPSQVKFWFQNKRTSMQSLKDRHQSSRLIADNHHLQALNTYYKEALQNTAALEDNSCPLCYNDVGGHLYEEEKRLMLENAQLKEKIKGLQTIFTSYIQEDEANIAQSDIVSTHSIEAGRFALSQDTLNLISGPVPHDLKQTIECLVAESIEVFERMALDSGRLWTSASSDGTTSLVNDEAVSLTEFLNIHGPTPDGFIPECSRQTGILRLSSHQLVKILMDVNEWSAMFSDIVLRAKTLEVLNLGEAYDGALHVMVAEFQLPTPLVPNREVYFARTCKKLNDGVWTVVDVSLNDVHPVGFTRCHKKPSGCIIHDMTDGSAKITWMEHVNVDYQGISTMYKDLLISGLGFGAKRWVSTLDRQLRRTALTSSPGVPTTDFNNFSMSSSNGRSGIIKLADRMLISFLSGVSSRAGPWNEIRGDFGDGISLMCRRNRDDPGLPKGTLLSVSTSFSLRVPPIMVFEYLRDPNRRNELDNVSNGMVLEPACHISTCQESENYIAIHNVQMEDTIYSNLLLLQGCWSDLITSYIVYAPGDLGSLNVVLGGENPSYLPLLPCGFAILPDGPAILKGGSCGSLLTVSHQVLINRSPMAGITVGAISKVTTTIKEIREKIEVIFGSASEAS